uniref:DNA recombination protein RmuC n=1 Tax=Ruminococcus sp. TaxID=41978 RepID=UPI00386BCD71
METVLLVIGIAAVILLAVLIVIVLISNKNKVDEQYLARQISADISRQQSELRQELTAQTQNSVGAMGGMLEQRLQGFAAENQRSLNSIRDTVEKRLNEIQTDNARQLDEMRRTVDEKLNKSLDEKFSNSFSLVSQRLEQVYKGLGEMQNLAVGVGDLKKVLSNVKTRGILGEIQLGSILAEILSPTQYEENAATKQGSRNRVEFAVKLPADEGGFIYLPIDSKFPGDTYLALRDAVESG